MSNSRNCCFARCLTSGTNNDREELIQTPPPATRSIKDYEVFMSIHIMLIVGKPGNLIKCSFKNFICSIYMRIKHLGKQ